MIPSIKLLNFQSHDHTVMDFHPGINAIVGGTDQGKSSILRGFRWLRDNRPSGDEFMSHWNWDGDKLVGRTEVTVEIEGAPTITRGRDSRFNGYLVGGDRLAAVRTDVPHQVAAALNMSEVNDQGQLDPPFLLTASPPEVARFFNRVLKLEEVDQLMGLMESRRRKAVATVEGLQSRVAENTQKLGELDWVDNGVALFEELQLWSQEALELEQRLTAQEASHTTFRNRQNQLDGLLWVELAEDRLQLLRDALGLLTEAREDSHAREEAGKRLVEIQKGLSRLEYLSPELLQQVEQLGAWAGRLGELGESLQLQTKALLRWYAMESDMGKVQFTDHPHLQQLGDLRQWVMSVGSAWLDIAGQESSLQIWNHAQEQLEQMSWTEAVEAQDPSKLKLVVERAGTVEAESQEKYRALIAYRSRAATIAMMDDNVRDLLARMPDVCPLCHQPHAKDQSHG